jgi:Protein of unknown function (DUF2845)
MRTLLIAAGAVLLLATAAAAQPMMCGTGIIGPGDSQLRVLQLCGAPAASRQWVETIPAGDDYQGMLTATQIPMAEWLYQDSPDQFASKVIFRNGVVAEIKN